MDEQSYSHADATEIAPLDFVCDPMADYRRAAEEKSKQPEPISLARLIGDSARRLIAFVR